MADMFNTIAIDGTVIYRSNGFTLQREYLYAGEIETCTGKRCADLVGWRYADLKLSWDMLPQAQLQAILNLSGQQVNMTFSNETGTSVTEVVIPKVLTSTATRLTNTSGRQIWKNIGLDVQFINAHN